MVHDDIQQFDRNLQIVLSSFSCSDYTAEFNDENRLTLSLEYEVDPIQLARLVEDKVTYLKAVRDDVTDEEIIEALVTDIDSALDIMFNSTRATFPEHGLYQKSGSGKWKKYESSNGYSAYKDLLWEITGHDTDPDNLSIPGLYEPFLRAVDESESHELPPEGAVQSIIREHIDNVRAENTSRKAVSTLKQRLESQGIDARTAANIAKSSEDLLKTDEEITELG